MSEDELVGEVANPVEARLHWSVSRSVNIALLVLWGAILLSLLVAAGFAMFLPALGGALLAVRVGVLRRSILRVSADALGAARSWKEVRRVLRQARGGKLYFRLVRSFTLVFAALSFREALSTVGLLLGNPKPADDISLLLAGLTLWLLNFLALYGAFALVHRGIGHYAKIEATPRGCPSPLHRAA